MRTTTTFLAASFSLLACAAAEEARIYLFDAPGSRRPDDSNTKLSSDAANLVLAHRLGNSDSLSLENADTTTLEQLNTFGGQQVPLLGNDDSQQPSKLLVLMQGVDASNQKDSFPSTITVAKPSKLAPDSIILDPLEHIPIGSTSHTCTYNLDTDDGFQAHLLVQTSNPNGCPIKEAFFTETSGNAVTQLLERGVSSWAGQGARAVLKAQFLKTTTDSAKSDAVNKIIDRSFGRVADLASSGAQETTFVLNPEKGTLKHVLQSHHKFRPRAALEEPLFQAVKPVVETPEDVESTTPVNSDAAEHISAVASKVPSTLLPVCHASNDSCVTTTNSCSGHGTCYLKYRSSADTVNDCYACRCHKTVISRYEDGSPKKTVSWGGPACQKKDISVQFFLLAGFTIVVVAFVAYGVGLLISVGESELPSVIGAGVSGPKAQR